jgi:hypothetical protein
MTSDEMATPFLKTDHQPAVGALLGISCLRPPHGKYDVYNAEEEDV